MSAPISHSLRALQILATPVCAAIPKDQPLEARIIFAMRYVRTHGDSLFWMMPGAPDDDMLFRTAIAAVMLAGSDEDMDIVERSMRPLKMLSAAMSGVPVDFSAIADIAADTLPLMKLWHETAKAEA